MNGRTSGLDGADAPGDAIAHAMHNAVAMAANAVLEARMGIDPP
jgi:hypothetical protein